MVTKNLFPKLTDECIEFVNATDFNKYFNEDNNRPLDNDVNTKSLKSMHTTLRRRGHEDLLNEIIPNYIPAEVDHTYFETIENYISNTISQYVQGQNDEDLVKIFHAVQFWGGSEGRYIYVMGKSFEFNFDIGEYKLLFSLCNKPDKLKIIKYCESNSRKIIRFGTSFITKHVKFITKYFHKEKNPELVLPIFDSIICESMFGYKTSPVKYISDYYEYLPKLCEVKKCTPELFENVLFNRSQSQ